MNREERRGPWFLITGLLIGAFLGLFYAWVISPVEFIDSSPDTLHPDYKDQYRSLVALAYQTNGDIGRAYQRLALLQDSAPIAELGGQVIRIRAESPENPEAAALELLAQALQQPGADMVKTQSAETATPPTENESKPTLGNNEAIQTATPAPPTPRPTFTQQATQTTWPELGALFALQDRQLVCDSDLAPGLLQIEVLNSSGEPLAGVRMTVTWDSGEESFSTGLKPSVSAGYADYQMEEERVYTVAAGTGGKPATDVKMEACSGGSLGGVKLIFSPE